VGNPHCEAWTASPKAMLLTRQKSWSGDVKIWWYLEESL
jgi:hypothetical protein